MTLIDISCCVQRICGSESERSFGEGRRMSRRCFPVKSVYSNAYSSWHRLLCKKQDTIPGSYSNYDICKIYAFSCIKTGKVRRF